MRLLNENLGALKAWTWEQVKTRPPLKPSEFAEAELFLPAATGTAKPGRLNLDHTPYMRGIVDAVETSRHVAMMTAAGVGKTTTLNIIACFYIAEKPRRMLWGRDSKAAIQKFVKLEWLPMIMESPRMRRLVPKDRTRFNSTIQQFMSGAPLTFTGMKSPGAVAGDTVHVILVDEADKNGEEIADREASPNQLIRHRVRRSDDPKEIFGSTPTTEQGDIYYFYIQGTQEKYMVPCPCEGCGQEIELQWKQVTFDHCRDAEGKWDYERVLKETYYKCQKCGGKITDDDKPEMLQKGRWVPTPFAEREFLGDNGPQPPLPGHRSFHLSALYSPWKVNAFGELAMKFMEGSASGLWKHRRDFANSIEGRPFKDIVEFKVESEEDITANYERGRLDQMVVLPDGRNVDLSTLTYMMGVDVQTYGLKWLVAGFAPNGEMFVLDHGLTPDFTTLDRIQAEYGVKAVICDIQAEIEGKQIVREAVYARQVNGQGWFASEMQDEMDEMVLPKSVDPFRGSGLAGTHKMACLWGSGYDWKREMDAKRSAKGLVPFWIYMKDRVGSAKDDNRATLVNELWGERIYPKKKKKAGSKHDKEYRKTRDNHFWDCCVMLLMLREYLERERIRVVKTKAAARAGGRVIGRIGA